MKNGYNLNKWLNITEKSLYNLIRSMPDSAHVKDAQNGKYLASSKRTLCTYGFTEERELLGLTFDDLNDFMIPYWGADFVGVINDFDRKVKTTGEAEVLKNLVFTDKHNFIRCQNMQKIPIFYNNTHGKMKFILTLTVEYTDEIDQWNLYKKYTEMNANKTEAMLHFMQYLGIDQFFYKPLTEKELLCLLTAKLNPAYKSIARSLNISVKTVETHLGNIANKLKNTTLQNVISNLRK